MFLCDLGVFRFLYQIPEHSQDDSGDLFLNRIAQDVGKNRDHVELVHLLGQERVEREHPQTENELVLHLEVDSARQHGEQCGDAVHRNKRKAVLVDAKHHLQATTH